jgi:ribokinase
MIGAVGNDDFGREMLANLRAAGVEASGVMRRAGTASGVALITVGPDGQNQIVVVGGANETLSPEEIARHAALFRRSKAVVTQLEVPLPAVEAALRAGREAGAFTVLNPAPCLELSDGLLQLCDWIVPNEIEAARLSGVTVRGRAGADAASQKLRRRSGANVLITLGPDGAWLEMDSFTGHVPAFKVEAIDTVGAGDTFTGAFVTRLVEGAAPRDAARFGCAAAALSVTRRGAQAGIPLRAEVEAWLRDQGA